MKSSGILTVGSELLRGSVLDTNSHFISCRLEKFLIEPKIKITVPDVKYAIKRELKRLLKEVDIIFITGGLGPTPDDLTAEALSEALSLPLIKYEEEEKKLLSKLKKKNLPINEYNLKQIYLPEGVSVMDNKYGTAPGFYIKHNGIYIFCMPGVPSEMRSMFIDSVEGILEDIAGRAEKKSLIVKTIGISESALAELIYNSGILDGYEFSMIPKTDGVHIEIILKDVAEVSILKDGLSKVIGSSIYGYDEDTLPNIVMDLSVSNSFTLSCAESCTAGLLSKLITDVAGSSKYFKGGITAYSNEIKSNILKVRNSILREFGAVSEECARWMAEGCRELFKSDFSVSITGIAGPGGGTPKKPVGTVCLGISTPNFTKTYKRLFSGSRHDIREKSAYNALNYIRIAMLNYRDQKPLNPQLL
ncbi:MAG: CinA family nicotinamide mononucleotide deamidase-related protein [Nitrospirae bacterium]|nr:MAG: CinA family nicotinamide mononucleotide deamidase-related protein [Nitrospirota bacterium]